MGTWLGAVILFILALLMGYGVTVSRRYGHQQRGEEPGPFWRVLGGLIIGGVVFYVVGFLARRSYLAPLWQTAFALGAGLGVAAGLGIKVRWKKKAS